MGIADAAGGWETGTRVIATLPLVAWLGTSLHGVTAVVSAIAAIQCRGTRRRLWVTICALQALLSADAALGWRRSVSEAGRTYARAHGFYMSRREPQVIASAAVLLGLSAAGWWLLHTLKRKEWMDGSNAAALVGTALCTGLTTLSMISLHQVETAMEWPAPLFNAGVLLHGAGATLALGGAWTFVRGARKSRTLDVRLEKT